MTQEIAKRNDKDVANMTDDDVLARARQENAPPMIQQSFDTLKFKDSEKKIEGLTRGNYFIESYDREAKKKVYRDIGPNPEIVVLHRCYTYSYYKEGEGLKAWTSDIQGFQSKDMATLFSKKGGRVGIEFIGNYQDLKNYMLNNYSVRDTEGNIEKLMSFQNLLYVLFEGKIYRMFVSNASASGIAQGSKGPDFKNPQPKSLLHYIETTRREPGAALCDYVCKLGSYFKDDVEQPYYIRTFENAGENTNVALAVPVIKQIYADIDRGQQMMSSGKASVALEPQIDYQERVSTIKTEDLPF